MRDSIRGLVGIEDHFLASIKELEDYIIKIKERPIPKANRNNKN